MSGLDLECDLGVKCGPVMCIVGFQERSGWRLCRRHAMDRLRRDVTVAWVVAR